MIRPYKAGDIDLVLDIWYTTTKVAHPFMEESFLAKERKNVRDIYIPNTKTWVWLEDDDVQAFISMMGNEVGAIFVRPALHGKGIGRKLMDHVRQFHESLEVEVFEDNEIGRRFYDRYGFSQIKRYIHEETGKAVLRLSIK